MEILSGNYEKHYRLGGQKVVKIIAFKPYRKNTLQGFVTVRLTNIGLEIRDIAYHKKNESEWFGLPAKSYKKEDGTEGYSYILKFYDKQLNDAFQAEIIRQLRDFDGSSDDDAF